jgi:uncharacterized protein (TIGR03083 family)
MMFRSVADARGWMQHGTALFMSQTDLGDRAPGEPSALPGWSRQHVLAHVAANADALGNLVRWAATGEPTPMYASPAERAAGIERGRQLPAGELKAWLRRSADALEEAILRRPAGRLPHRVVRRRDRKAKQRSRPGACAGGY